MRITGTIKAIRILSKTGPRIELVGNLSYIARRAMETRLDAGFAGVAAVDEAVASLRVQFVEKSNRRVLGTTQRRELVVFISGQSQKGIPTIHQVAVHQRIGIFDVLQFGSRLQPYHKEALETRQLTVLHLHFNKSDFNQLQPKNSNMTHKIYILQHQRTRLHGLRQKLIRNICMVFKIV